MLLTPNPMIASAVAQPEHAATAAALFLVILGVLVMGSFAWAGYRLLKREKAPLPDYAEFLDQDAVEEVDAELDGSGR